MIKPSGVDYEIMKESDIVVCDLDGKVIEGNLKPSSDLMTHIEIYKNFKDVGGLFILIQDTLQLGHNLEEI